MLHLPDSFFITGTDTGVGKTYLAAQLVRERRANALDCVGMKPICCGDRGDAEALHEASGGVIDLNTVNPLWLRTPAAPYAAGMVEARPIDPAQLLDTFQKLRIHHRQIIVEGVGGWRVPITREYAVSDLAADLKLPVLVVAINRLGVLNHTLLTVEAIQARGLECIGVILNHLEPRGETADVALMTNAAILGELLNVPLVGELPFGGTLPVAHVAAK